MTFKRSILILFFRLLTRILCRIHGEELMKVPHQGPLIIVINHVNILEIPLIYVVLQPRPIGGFSAAKRWKVWWSRWLLNTAGAIPLHRGEADIKALRKGLDWLEEGNILLIAPEGTRSYTGHLQRGHPGVVLLAMRTGATILPLVFYGHEYFEEKLKKLRRVDFYISVGEPFYLDTKGKKVTQHNRQQIADEIMYKMAALLPPEYRGVYSDLNVATEHFLSKHPPDLSAR
jgi:1-acyl-sn-glycerol-3-phosphate acyltransferase